jgi:hypothetical protein
LNPPGNFLYRIFRQSAIGNRQFLASLYYSTC